MPTCKILEGIMLGQGAEREIENISLSKSKIFKHFGDMSLDAD
jgi:hypothetical protein